MKKSVFIAAILGLSLMACKKENKTNAENDAPNLNSLKMDENKSYTYLATNSDRANLSFQNDGDNHTITIKANNMKYVLDKKDADSASMVFERNGVSAKLTKDSLNIMQGDKVIPLVRTN
ncbi:hypothetical protein SAMN05421847_0952 [Halpernia humi]|uniref:Uncharacterized protein n=1 Tax=Halpernia humi TaxID=493375 RepID=A0A1H5UWC8_9FLAO|nr:hypothetical protein [Halpernia humi]SEF79395.1 hypothetical protein SAMN05421847_0952 [Halpernia humi]